MLGELPIADGGEPFLVPKLTVIGRVVDTGYCSNDQYILFGWYFGSGFPSGLFPQVVT